MSCETYGFPISAFISNCFFSLNILPSGSFGTKAIVTVNSLTGSQVMTFFLFFLIFEHCLFLSRNTFLDFFFKTLTFFNTNGQVVEIFFRPCWYDSATVLLFHLEWLDIPPVILYTLLTGPRSPLQTQVIKWMGRQLQNHTCQEGTHKALAWLYWSGDQKCQKVPGRLEASSSVIPMAWV